jgi:hypothetical protein
MCEATGLTTPILNFLTAAMSVKGQGVSPRIVTFLPCPICGRMAWPWLASQPIVGIQFMEQRGGIGQWVQMLLELALRHEE